MTIDEHMLSTVDNPFNPHTQFDEWSVHDKRMGYHTSELLARIATVSTELPYLNQSLAIEQAIDEIVRENVSGMHVKIKPPS
jgi:hypothetical protein